MNKISFSTNWNNKLDNKVFTTIRPYNPKNFIINQVFEIYHNKNLKGKAEIIKLDHFNLEVIPEGYCYLDTGYSKKETVEIINKMYSGKVYIVSLIFLKYIKEEHPPLLTGGC